MREEDELSRRDLLTYGSGAYTDYTYDCENRLLSSTCDTLNPAHLGPDVVENGTFTGNANESDAGALKIPIGLKYDKYGNVEEVNDPNGDKWRLRFNALEQLTRITSPDANTLMNLSYNPCKLLSAIRRPIGDVNQVVGFEYDVLDHLAEVADPCSYVTSVNYNWRGNLLDVNDAEENQTRLKYNERGLVCEVVDANGGVTIFKYTLNGKVREVNDPNGNMTLFKYDGFDRLYKIIYPDETYEQFGYDKNSNVTNWRVRDGNTIYYEYNALNRLTEKKVADWPSIKFGYDIMARVVEVNDLRDVNEGGGVSWFWYDRIGRVTLVKDIYGRYVGYQYYDTGLRKKLDYPGTAYDLNYKYDALGRVTQLKRLFSPMAEYKYDQLSRRTLLTYGNDAEIVYEYDVANQLRKISNNINDGNVIEFAYPQYDKVGNRLSMKIDSQPSQVYDYDKLYQLINVDYNDDNETGYHYDTLGNRLDVNENGSVTYYWNNELNQYTQVGTENYSYDDNGNLIDDGVYKYYYDCEDRLTDVNDGSDGPVASYKYDWAGRRVRKITYYNEDVNEITEYLYDGWHCIAEYDGDTCLRRFYYGPLIDEPVMMRDVGENEKYYYHYDGLGSVAALSDNSGNIVERYSYDVFGEPNRVSSVGNPYMFTGRRYDDETGLYYYRYRYYSAETGRFLQTDPIGYYYSMNLYEYCWNDPLNWIDPFGLTRERSMANLVTAPVRTFLRDVDFVVRPSSPADYVNAEDELDIHPGFNDNIDWWRLPDAEWIWKRGLVTVGEQARKRLGCYGQIMKYIEKAHEKIRDYPHEDKPTVPKTGPLPGDDGDDDGSSDEDQKVKK